MRAQNVSHVHRCALVKKEYTFLEKTSHNFVEIIKSTLNIDVNCYANGTNTRLFVCKTSCYKRLLKFHDQRATEKAEEAKKEIKDAFQARPRANACFDLQMEIRRK